MKPFEADFLIGAATAAHQVEGNNVNSDFWAQEHMKNTDFAEPSLDAVDHFNRYQEDIAMMADAGLNAYRFSIEWARIEPKEGVFDEAAVAHYRDVIACCKAHGVEPIVTLHHFSSPKWLISKGGWEAETTPGDFARYTRYIIERLGSELRYVCTINEANMGIQVTVVANRYRMLMMEQMAKVQASDASVDSNIQMGINIEKLMSNRKAFSEESKEVYGVADPQTFTSPRTPHGDYLITEAHKAARAVIRELCPHIKVGLTLSLHDIQALPGGENLAQKTWDDDFTHYLPVIADDDFLGVQNYTRARYDANGEISAPEGAELTQMDYEFYPQALEKVLRRVAEVFHGDLIVTENGIATADDTRRVAFIQTAVSGVKNCIADGLPVKGYIHWSLMDNFEWQKGFSMQFGLIAVDRSTQMRFPKPSLAYLGDCLRRGHWGVE